MFIFIKNIHISNIEYDILVSNTLNNCIYESIVKNYNIIYAIKVNDKYKYYGSNEKDDQIINKNTNESFCIILSKNYKKYIDIIFKKKKENIFILKSNLKNLNKSYNDFYKKIKNIDLKNNYFLYFTKNDNIFINFKDYIFDIVIIDNQKIKIDLFLKSYLNNNIVNSKILVFNMNYFIFMDGEIEDILKNNNGISNNNQKYKNFIIFPVYKLKDDYNLSKIKNINIIKIS